MVRIRVQAREGSAFTDEEVIAYAHLASTNKTRFVKLASEWQVETCDALSKAANALFGRKLQLRSILGELTQALKIVPRLRVARDDEADEKRASLERRKKLAVLARSHPKGRLIGSVQTLGFKAPGSKRVWGTRRRRRP